jgi:hypothetical protein
MSFNPAQAFEVVEAVLGDYENLQAGKPVTVGPYSEEVNIGGKTYTISETVVVQLKTVS